MTNIKDFVMKLESLRELLCSELKDIYSAETQILKALPKMAKKASNEELKAGFKEHLEQTQAQVERLDKIGEKLGISLKGKKCKAMEGLLAEGKEIMSEDAEVAVMDAALICAAQKVEHYEIASYGCVRTWAQQLEETEIADLLQETLDEETETDKKLTELSNSLNMEAAEMAGASGDDE